MDHDPRPFGQRHPVPAGRHGRRRGRGDQARQCRDADEADPVAAVVPGLRARAARRGTGCPGKSGRTPARQRCGALPQPEGLSPVPARGWRRCRRAGLERLSRTNGDCRNHPARCRLSRLRARLRSLGRLGLLAPGDGGAPIGGKIWKLVAEGAVDPFDALLKGAGTEHEAAASLTVVAEAVR